MITTAQQLSSLGIRSEAGTDLALHAPRVSRSPRPRGSAAIPETRLEFPGSRESSSPQIFQLASSRPRETKSQPSDP